MARDRILQIYRGTTAQNNAFTGAQGELTMDTDRKEIRIHDGSTAGGNVVGLTPGFIAPFAGSTAPDGWLVCDGSAISRTRYADLFAVIGTTYGSGDGNTTFNLPNQSPSHKVIEKQEPTSANDYFWYRLYDDGWVEQGGTKVAAQKTITIPIEMANTDYTVLKTINNDYSGNINASNWASVTVVRISTTQIRLNAAYGADNQSWTVYGMSARGITQQNIMCIKY